MLDQNKIIFTGGSGLLGTAFKKLMPEINYPPSAQFNVTDFAQMDGFVRNGSYGMIIHAAAFTSPPKIEQEPSKAIDVNIIGTANIARVCMKYGLSSFTYQPTMCSGVTGGITARMTKCYRSTSMHGQNSGENAR